MQIYGQGVACGVSAAELGGEGPPVLDLVGVQKLFVLPH